MNRLVRSLAVVGVLLLSARLLANPVVDYSSPVYAMVAENVLVGVTDHGCHVTGRYVFRKAKWARERWKPTLERPVDIDLPVPMPRGAVSNEMVSALVRPILTWKGVRYEADPRGNVELLALRQVATLRLFRFRDLPSTTDESIEVVIDYDQPIIHADGKDLVVYVPFLPHMAGMRNELGIKEESFLITIEAHSPVHLRLQSYHETILRQTNRLVAVRPKHMKALVVERIPATKEPSHADTPTHNTP